MAQPTNANPSQQSPSLFDICIIGAGPSGLFGAYYAGFREMSTAIVDAIPEPGGQLAVLYPEKFIFDVPGYPQVLARDLAKSLFIQATKFNPVLYMGEKANQLVRNSDSTFSIITDKRTINAKSVLITAGVGSFSPNRLNIENQESDFARSLART